MKTTIILSEEGRQINLKAENEQEKLVLKMFKPDSNINVLVKEGSFGETGFKTFTIDINGCRGGYLRCFDDENSIMLSITEPPVQKEIDYEEVKMSCMNVTGSTKENMLDEDYSMGYYAGIQAFIKHLKEL